MITTMKKKMTAMEMMITEIIKKIAEMEMKMTEIDYLRNLLFYRRDHRRTVEE
jgi:hypothetical protein